MRIWSSSQSGAGRTVVIVAILVAVITFLCYLPALRGEFLIWDDPMYVFNNPHLRSFDLNFISWALTDISTGFWLPVIWISYAFDYLVWGMNPFGFHLSSIILHALNSMLVVFTVARLLADVRGATADGNPSMLDGDGALVAAGVTGLLFGLHPLHTEPVAWISDRKDLLCSFFFFLSLLSYLKYSALKKSFATVQGSTLHGSSYYFFTLVLFLLALASKGTAIVLPLVLLLVDYFPFGRFRDSRDFRLVYVEKIPFFILGVLVTVLSLSAQKGVGALTTYGSLTLYERALTAFRATALYLWKMAVPLKFVPYYPHPARITLFAPEYLLGALAVLGFTLFFAYLGNRHKIVLVAWLYYLFTLSPVSGIVPIGAYSMADRYAYLPSFGPFLLIGLAAAWLWSKGDGKVAFRRTIVVIGALYFLILSTLLVRQIGIWNNSVTLWSHVIEKGPYEIPLAYSNRGMAFLELGEYEQAIADCTRALAIQSDYHLAYYNRGKAYLLSGNLIPAMADLNRTIAIAPKYAEAYALRGELFRDKADLKAAIDDYSAALALNTEMYEVYLKRGIAYKESGDFVRAIEDYNRTLALVPDSPEAFNSRGVANRYLGRLELALADYGRAIGIDPGFSLAYCNRGIVYKEMKNYELAIADFKRATAISPDLIKAYLEAGDCYRLMGRPDLAEHEYRAACSLNSAEGCTALQGIRK